jgi:hypothetical protein
MKTFIFGATAMSSFARSAPIERPRQRNLLAGRAGRLPVDLASRLIPGNRTRSIHQAAADEITACLENTWNHWHIDGVCLAASGESCRRRR